MYKVLHVDSNTDRDAKIRVFCNLYNDIYLNIFRKGKLIELLKNGVLEKM